ncbi:diuretic hormone receptor-like [Limulus polyphemus]|uniref:Diuretic hormone receptor-like n=1 Tax=Limulus polyphemus TaxID=6850 RepID=A0ABM1TNV9_LIMPO|nr:diuretic hormone receptor-like [Limulus polyphemus]
MGTNFFWMFVEGLYLYVLVVKTFSFEVIKVQIYALVGWGLPAIVVFIWALSKAYFSPLSSDTFLLVGCPWQNRDSYDYIFIVPVIIVLLVNIFFLGQIMWVLITKLRAASTIEQKQYRKAAKALLVLIPLLGVTYVLVIVTPTHRTARIAFTYIQATLLSTQGLTVSILYCFLNGEVRNTLHQHLERWRTSRSLQGYSTRCRFTNNRDSPRLTARERADMDWTENRKNSPIQLNSYTTGGACTRGNSNEEAV